MEESEKIVDAHVAQLVAAAPPFSDETRAKLRVLLPLKKSPEPGNN